MADKKSWLTLLGPLPSEGGDWHQETRTDAALKGWTQVRLVLGNGITGLRALTAEEEEGLRRLAAALQAKCNPWNDR